MGSKPGSSRCSGKSLAITCLLARRSPAQRWHELDMGFYMERGNLNYDVKGEIQVEDPLELEYQSII